MNINRNLKNNPNTAVNDNTPINSTLFLIWVLIILLGVYIMCRLCMIFNKIYLVTKSRYKNGLISVFNQV